MAGDIGSLHKPKCLVKAIDHVAPRFKHVIYVAGNHEFYNGSLKGGVVEINNLIKHHPNIIFDNFEKIPFEFLGSSNKINNIWMATLWTDYRNGNPIEMQACEGVMNDHNHIQGFAGRPATAQDFLEIHNCMREQLFEGLKFGDVVITHHLPSYQSVAPKYKGDPYNGAYASELSHLIEEKAPRLFIHGHTHESCDYMIGRTRVICNPRGYYMDINKKYIPDLVIEV